MNAEHRKGAMMNARIDNTKDDSSRRSKGKAPFNRDEQWRKAGVKVVPLPEHTGVVIMRGGLLADMPQPGDPVEVFADQGEGKDGEWVSGLVALSNLKQGKLGGPYEGELIIWVGSPETSQQRGQGAMEG